MVLIPSKEGVALNTLKGLRKNQYCLTVNDTSLKLTFLNVYIKYLHVYMFI